MSLCILCVSMYQSVSKWAVSTLIVALVYPPELSRIVGFCTNYNKNFLGEDPQTPLSSRIIWGCIITTIQQNHLKKLKTHTQNLPPPHHFSGKLKIKWSLYVLFEKSIVDHFFVNGCLEEQRKVLEKSLKIYLKSPWKVLEKGMSWSVGTMVKDVPYWFWGQKVKGQGHGLSMFENGFRTITDYVIHLWSWNFIHLLPMSQGCALLILGSKGQRSRSWIINVWKGFPDHNWLCNPPMIMKLHTLAPHESRMCPIDFGVKRSKVKVMDYRCLKMVSGP